MKKRHILALLIALALWSVAYLGPLVTVAIQHEDLGRIVRLYPGQFVFILLPFLVAIVCTFQGYVRAQELAAKPVTPDRIRTLVKTRVIVMLCLAVGFTIATVNELTSTSDVYMFADPDNVLETIDTRVKAMELFRGSHQNDPGYSKLEIPTSVLWTVRVFEFLELTIVVATAYLLIVTKRLLAELRLVPGLSLQVQRTAILPCIALGAFLTWPPLRMATLTFLRHANVEKFGGFAPQAVVWAVLLGIFFASVLTVTVFTTRTAAKVVIGLVLPVVSGIVTGVLATSGSVIIYQTFASKQGIGGAIMFLIVLLLGLYHLYGFLVGGVLADDAPEQPAGT